VRTVSGVSGVTMVSKLIVFEGLDGSGKATQTKLLLNKLKTLKIPAATIDFPQYGSWSAAFVEKYLNGEFGLLGEITPEQASLFYALDRFAARKKLLQMLADKIVIANRYVSANQAYQGSKITDLNTRRQFLAWLDHLEYGILGLPRPSHVVYLKVPLMISNSLVEQRHQREYIKDGNKDIHEKSNLLLKGAEEVYGQLAQGNEWITVDCAADGKLLSKELIHEKVWTALKDII